MKKIIQLCLKILILLVLFLQLSLGANPILVYSHSLHGNLIACTCTRVPIAGLSRRDSFLESKNIKKSESIFLELGNFFSTSDSPDKRKAILEGLQTIGNTYLFPGKQELQSLGITEWKDLPRERIILSNVKEKGFLKNSNLFPVSIKTTLNGKKYLLTSILSEKSFQTLPSVFQSKYKFIQPKEQLMAILKEEVFDTFVLGLIGESKDFEELASILPVNRLLFLVPFSNVQPKNGVLENQVLGKIFSTSGKNGDEIGFLKIEYQKPPRAEIQTIQIDTWTDSPSIQKIAEKWNLPSTP